jgi:hypothetical protein
MKSRTWVLLAAVFLALVALSPASGAPEPAQPESPAAVVRAYLNAAHWEERLQYVLRPTEVKPFMQARYAADWKAQKYQIEILDESPGASDDWVVVQVKIGDHANAYYLQRTPQGLRIDWENSVGFNRISSEQILATKPLHPVRFRVLAQLNDYANFQFKDPEDAMLNLQITDAEGKSIGQAFLDKNSADGRTLFKALKDGRQHAIAVDLRYLSSAPGGAAFLISKVVRSDSWFFEPGT